MFPKEVINTPAAQNYITSRLVRWDVATGEIAASMELPKLAPGSVFVKWSWLPGGREVWWETWPGQRSEQTLDDVLDCKAPAPVPAFESEVVENCSYWWAVSVLDIETGKRRYLAPVMKNVSKSGSVGQPERIVVVARLSPNGRHLALIKKSMWKTAGMSGRDPSLEKMEINVYALPEPRLIGSFARGEEDRYEIGVGNLVFSGESRWMAFKLNDSAWIFDLGDKQ